MRRRLALFWRFLLLLGLQTAFGVGLSAVAAPAVQAQPLGVSHPISSRVGAHENQDWFEFRGFHYTDGKRHLPRVLLVGDSISGGYRSRVRELLEGTANVTWLTVCYGADVPNWRRLLELCLDDADYAVVHVNNGLHSLDLEDGAYAESLREILRLIRRKQPQAKIVWASTTPDVDPRRNARVDALNAAADRVVREEGIDGIDDLSAVMMAAPEERRWSDGCHPTPEVSDKLALAVARSLLPHLGVPPAVAPSRGQLEHLEDGIMAIVHFGLNTFVDKEWGFGDTPPAVFNPARLDTDQWADAMAAVGIRRVVMVAKHHDGFCLWPSPLNPDYTVANTPWKGGKGDVVKMIWESCRRKGLRFGVYLSPWDRHQASYGTAAYADYYHRQFEELFRDYGPISEIWLDGANGGDGWYGGSCERRKLAQAPWAYYRIPDLLNRLHELYPNAVAFNGEGPNSVAWVGNESGYAPVAVNYVSTRGFWETPECDTPLRKGWFWHEKDAPKPLSELVDVYFSSVGRGCVLNLGIAPNREGLVGADDVKRLKEFGDYVRRFNAVDFASGATVWRTPGVYQIDLAQPAAVNAVEARENLSLGQKIASWRFEYDRAGEWIPVVESATVGYRRIERFPDVTARRFRLVVTESKPGALVERVALRRAPEVPREPDAAPLRKYFVNEGVEVTVSAGSAPNELVAKWKYPGLVRGFKFDPRHNLGNLPDKWELRLSEDGVRWGEVVAHGEFGNILANPVEQFADFEKPLKIRYAKLTATHAVKGEAAFNPAHKWAVIFY